MQPAAEAALTVSDRKNAFDAPLVGKRVVVGGTNKKEINGLGGRVLRFDASTARYVIKLDNGRTFQLKTGNLKEDLRDEVSLSSLWAWLCLTLALLFY